MWFTFQFEKYNKNICAAYINFLKKLCEQEDIDILSYKDILFNLESRM